MEEGRLAYIAKHKHNDREKKQDDRPRGRHKTGFPHLPNKD